MSFLLAETAVGGFSKKFLLSPLRLSGYAEQAAQPSAKTTAGLINEETNYWH
jgi:hypothetical protein